MLDQKALENASETLQELILERPQWPVTHIAEKVVDAYLAKLTATKAEPSRIAEQFVALDASLGGVDGYDLTHWHEGEGGTTGIDHGTCDAGDAFKAMEAIKAHITAIDAALKSSKPGEG